MLLRRQQGGSCKGSALGEGPHLSQGLGGGLQPPLGRRCSGHRQRQFSRRCLLGLRLLQLWWVPGCAAQARSERGAGAGGDAEPPAMGG